MDSRELLRVLKDDGWEVVATKGSHHQLKHPIKKGRVTLPHPKKDLPIGTIRSIKKQAGLE
jgi:predicted RNA binding protein YcfA (HicA-like mRNA interferase family)